MKPTAMSTPAPSPLLIDRAPNSQHSCPKVADAPLPGMAGLHLDEVQANRSGAEHQPQVVAPAAFAAVPRLPSPGLSPQEVLATQRDDVVSRQEQAFIRSMQLVANFGDEQVNSQLKKCVALGVQASKAHLELGAGSPQSIARSYLLNLATLCCVQLQLPSNTDPLAHESVPYTLSSLLLKEARNALHMNAAKRSKLFAATDASARIFVLHVLLGTLARNNPELFISVPGPPTASDVYQPHAWMTPQQTRTMFEDQLKKVFQRWSQRFSVARVVGEMVWHQPPTAAPPQGQTTLPPPAIPLTAESAWEHFTFIGIPANQAWNLWND